MTGFRLHLFLELALCLWIGPPLVQLKTQIYVQETTGQDEIDSQQQDDEPLIGQKAPHCKYSFVVNEVDSSKCPILLDNLNSHYKSSAMQSEQPMGRRGRHGNGFRNQAHFGDNRLHKRIEMLEDKLSKETEENQVLRTSLDEHSKLLMQAEKTLANQNVNLTNLLLNMHDINHKLNKQRMVWRNMDNKLSGTV